MSVTINYIMLNGITLCVATKSTVLSVFMLSVTVKSAVLSVFMLRVIRKSSVLSVSYLVSPLRLSHCVCLYVECHN
jgi:DNA-binding MltR family transcriptional regulator